MVTTHYDNLQVTRNASPEVIKGAYKYLSQKWHPDKNQENRDEAERVLKIINRAYSVLSDPQLRREHDNWIAQQEREATASSQYTPAYQADQLRTSESAAEEKFQTISLWNPNAAANWSLLFSPILGAWLHSKNWTTLGEDEKAKHSMVWVYIGPLIIIIGMLLPENAGRAIGAGYLFGWYFSSAKTQARYVKDRVGSGYLKRGWIKPLGLAATALAAFAITVGFILSEVDPQIKRETALDEINGIWKANKENAMVVFQLDEGASTVKINEKSFPVTISDFDSDNKIVTLRLREDPSVIWSVRQIFDETNHFTLQMTLEDGTQADLSFVRNN